MNQYYFVGPDNKSHGPISPNECARNNVGPDTLVCPVGGSTWTPAGRFPELAPYINGGGAQQPPYVPGGGYQGTGNNNSLPPDNYLVWAILVTVLCCLPFGIVAIVKAANVNPAWYAGRREEALRNSESAKKWCIYSAVASVAGVILYFALAVLSGIFGLFSMAWM